MNGWDSGAYEREHQDHVDRYVLLAVTTIGTPRVYVLSDFDNLAVFSSIVLGRVNMLAGLLLRTTDSERFVRVVRGLVALTEAGVSNAALYELRVKLREAAVGCPSLALADFVAAHLRGSYDGADARCTALVRETLRATENDRAALAELFDASGGIVDTESFGSIWVASLLHYATLESIQNDSGDTQSLLRRADANRPQFDTDRATFYGTEHAARLIAVLERNVLPDQARRTVEPFGDVVRASAALANAYGDSLLAQLLLSNEGGDRDRTMQVLNAEIAELGTIVMRTVASAKVVRLDALAARVRVGFVSAFRGARVGDELRAWLVSGDHRLRYYAGHGYEPRPAVFIEAEQPALRALDTAKQVVFSARPFSDAEQEVIITLLEIALMYEIANARMQSDTQMNNRDLLRGDASLRLQLADAIQIFFDDN